MREEGYIPLGRRQRGSQVLKSYSESLLVLRSILCKALEVVLPKAVEGTLEVRSKGTLEAHKVVLLDRGAQG